MPLSVKKQGTKFRVIEKNTGKLALNKGGKPLDGGGHASMAGAKAQAAAVNISQARKRGAKIPRK